MVTFLKRMPPREKQATVAFLEAEQQVFAGCSLEPRARQLRLQRPPLALRIVEFGDGEPALFLHGLSLCTAHWAPLISRLPSLRSIAIDMPGHGGSEGVDYRGVDLRHWYKELLTGCLDELGLDSVHVVGHSQGSTLGMWLALDAPERVRSLVAIGTPAVAFGASAESLRMLALPGIGPLLLVRATYLATRRASFGSTVSTYLREMFRGMGSEPQRYVLSADELARIHQPVLIIWGHDDDRFQSIAEARERAALIPNARFEVVPGGHEPWLDDLQPCARLVSAFLKP
jgi:pimeloyl-ACP methyl ester carboxylesterase